MNDKNGWPIKPGDDVMTPDGQGRVVGVYIPSKKEPEELLRVRVRLYLEGSVVFTHPYRPYKPANVEVIGQSLLAKLQEERQTR